MKNISTFDYVRSAQIHLAGLNGTSTCCVTSKGPISLIADLRSTRLTYSVHRCSRGWSRQLFGIDCLAARLLSRTPLEAMSWNVVLDETDYLRLPSRAANLYTPSSVTNSVRCLRWSVSRKRPSQRQPSIIPATNSSP